MRWLYVFGMGTALAVSACGAASEEPVDAESEETVATVEQGYSCGRGGLFDEVGTCPAGLTCEGGVCVPRRREPGDRGGRGGRGWGRGGGRRGGGRRGGGHD